MRSDWRATAAASSAQDPRRCQAVPAPTPRWATNRMAVHGSYVRVVPRRIMPMEESPTLALGGGGGGDQEGGGLTISPGGWCRVSLRGSGPGV